jgi:uncharacterized protein HemY
MQAEMAKWKAKLPSPNASVKTGETLPDPKDKVEVQNLLHDAMLASDDNRSSDARQFLEKALHLDPSSPTAFRQLGELELAAGDFAKAAVHLKRSSELRPDDSTAAFELGEAAEKSGNWPGARDALESSLKLAPSQMSARLLLGRVYLQLKDAKNAEDQFEAALLVDSNSSDGRLGLAEAQIQQSDFAGALPDLEAFTKSDPRNATALRLLARAYHGLGREQDAKRIDGQAAALGKK